MRFNRSASLKFKRMLDNAVPASLQYNFENLYESLDYENYSPVTRLENELGISGIYKKYNFPDNVDAFEFEEMMKPMRIFDIIERGAAVHNIEDKILIEELNKIKPQSLVEIKKMYDDLVDLNPELKAAKIDENKVSSYVAVISGACSGFPSGDIIEFCNSNGNFDRINERKDQQSLKLEQMSSKKNLIKNWCPSDETFKKIMEKTEASKTPKKAPNYEAYMSFMVERGFYD